MTDLYILIDDFKFERLAKYFDANSGCREHRRTGRPINRSILNSPWRFAGKWKESNEISPPRWASPHFVVAHGFSVSPSTMCHWR